MYDSYLNRIGRMAIVGIRVCTPGVGCRTWERSRTIPYDLYTVRIDTVETARGADFMYGCIYTASYDLACSLTVMYDH